MTIFQSYEYKEYMNKLSTVQSNKIIIFLIFCTLLLLKFKCNFCHTKSKHFFVVVELQIAIWIDINFKLCFPLITMSVCKLLINKKDITVLIYNKQVTWQFWFSFTFFFRYIRQWKIRRKPDSGISEVQQFFCFRNTTQSFSASSSRIN